MPAAEAVYSIRKAVLGYSGPAFLVRNATNSAQANVAFDSTGKVSATSTVTITSVGTSAWTVGQTMAFSTFYSGASVYVITLYDQSGNGLNATEATTTTQAYLVSSGTLYTSNSLPALYFAGSDYYTATLPSAPGNTNFTQNVVAAGGGTVLTLSGTAGGSSNSCLGAANTVPSGGSTGPWYGGYGQDAPYEVHASATTANSVLTKTYNYTARTDTGYLNGSGIFSNTSTTYNLTTANIVLGGQVTGGGYVFLTGSMQDSFVFYSTLSTADRQALEHVQEAYYGISGI
jgi:hypothetical protein